MIAAALRANDPRSIVKENGLAPEFIIFISKFALFIIMCKAASGSLTTPHAGKLALGFSITLLTAAAFMNNKTNKGMVVVLSLIFILLAALNLSKNLTAKQLGSAMLTLSFGFYLIKMVMFCKEHNVQGIQSLYGAVGDAIGRELQ